MEKRPLTVKVSGPGGEFEVELNPFGLWNAACKALGLEDRTRFVRNFGVRLINFMATDTEVGLVRVFDPLNPVFPEREATQDESLEK